MSALVKTSAPLKSGPQVREEFAVLGLSISAWARAHGYSAQLVYQVLTGRKRCLRGQSHQIAVRLGLKRGLIGSVSQIGNLTTDSTDVQVVSPTGRVSEV